MLVSQGTSSKFECMSEKYPVITVTTGNEIYKDPEFDIISKEYEEFMNDYNRMIHREIRSQNVKGIYNLCVAIYHNDRAFPWFDPMLQVAIQESSFRIFCFVYYMHQFWYEEREDEFTMDELIAMTEGTTDGAAKAEFLRLIQVVKKSKELIDQKAEELEVDEDVFVMHQKSLEKLFSMHFLVLDIKMDVLEMAWRKAVCTDFR